MQSLIPLLISGGGAIFILLVIVYYLYRSDSKASKTIGELQSQLQQDKKSHDDKLQNLRQEIDKYRSTMSNTADNKRSVFEGAALHYHSKYALPDATVSETGGDKGT